ncbi:MAG: hypothetical protein NTW03_13755 [Verrucomicrobia bacterium]|nr:hypothetical protein [Verrucomicrobiota bacterium]
MTWILRILARALCVTPDVRAADPPVAPDWTALKTWSVMGKEEEILEVGKEVELLGV